MPEQKSQDLAAEIGPLIAQSRRIIWLAAAKRLQDEGESMLTFQVLGQCMRNGPMTQRALADALAQHPAGISRMIDEMEQRKLVKRARDPHDRRRVNVAITARGQTYHERFQPHVVEVVQAAITPLSSAERRTLRDLLRKLVNASAPPRS